MLELAVLARDEAQGLDALLGALSSIREKWEAETTLNNLNLIREARQRRGDDQPAWIGDAMTALSKAAT